MHINVDDQELNAEFTALLKNVSPANRRKIAKEIAMKIRANRSDSIKANIGPDGKKFEPRKPQNRKGAKRGRMFRKLGARRSLVAKYSPAQALVYFRGKNMSIAKIHHEGGCGVVNKQGFKVRYPERPLLGIGANERDIVRDAVVDALANGTHMEK